MPRPQQTGPLDEARDYLGDAGWRGVNMRLDADQLEPGFASKAVNMRFRDGVPETRKGSMVIPWLNKISSGNIQPWGTVYGRGPFRDPVTFHEYELVAADGNVYACLANNAPILLTLPAGVTVTSRCTFLQAFNVVILGRGFDADPLVLNAIGTGFEEIESSTEGTGLLTIPRFLRGVFMANRVFLLREDDTLVASDVLDYTHYTALNDLRINQGDADKGVALAKFGRSSLVVLKEKSVYLLENVFSDLSDITLTQVTGRYGCGAAETVVDCGADLVWLTNENKLAGLLLTIQNEAQASQGAFAGKMPSLSDPLSPIFDRINGAYAANAVGALWNDRYYIALPIDQAEMFGPELVSGFTRVMTNEYVLTGLVAGAVYVWASESPANGVVNGTESWTYATRGRRVVFTAQGTSITLTFEGLEGGQVASPASVRRYFAGVNGMLAHYDFVNQAWGGWDEATDIAFKQIFLGTYVKRQRLFVSTPDGYVRLWEEGFADRLASPYVDVTVTAQPAAGNTIRVNAGSIVTAIAGASNDGALGWGVDTGLALAAANLWTDASSATETGGYAPDTINDRWTSPNAIPYLITSGVRFYATNGVLPTVATTGNWATKSYYVERDVQWEFVTRGYTHPEAELSDFHGLIVDLQTWNATFSVNLLTDGVNEDVEVTTGVSKDRTRYYFPFDAAPYVVTNIGNNFFTAGREDYSIQPTGAAYEFTPGANVRGDLHQDAREPWDVTLAGRSARVQLLGTRGRCRIGTIRITETVDDQTAGPIA